MSIGNEESLDVELPGDSVDTSKVADLGILGSLAVENTNQVRQLQRRLYTVRQDPTSGKLVDSLEELINKRVIRGYQFVRRRNELQKKEQKAKFTILEEALRTTVGKINTDKNHILDLMADLTVRIQKMKDKYAGESVGEQRKIAARLMQWERTFNSFTLAVNNLPSLPNELEI